MRVIVRYFGYLTDYSGREVTVDVVEGVRVKDVVQLPPDIDIEDLVILVNGRPAKPDTPLKDGDIVSVLPHVSGGM